MGPGCGLPRLRPPLAAHRQLQQDDHPERGGMRRYERCLGAVLWHARRGCVSMEAARGCACVRCGAHAPRCACVAPRGYVSVQERCGAARATACDGRPCLHGGNHLSGRPAPGRPRPRTRSRAHRASSCTCHLCTPWLRFSCAIGRAYSVNSLLTRTSRRCQRHAHKHTHTHAQIASSFNHLLAGAHCSATQKL